MTILAGPCCVRTDPRLLFVGWLLRSVCGFLYLGPEAEAPLCDLRNMQPATLLQMLGAPQRSST